MQPEILKRYAELHAQKAQIEAEIKAYNESLLLQMTDVDSIDFGLGKITKVKRKNYWYSEKVKALDLELKNQKRFEEEYEIASVTESEYLRFTPAK